MELKKFNIEGDSYSLVDVRNVAIVDSFVKNNKLSYTTGNGEARLYTVFNLVEFHQIRTEVGSGKF